MSTLNEPTIKSETIFEGKIITVQVDDVQLPNGKTATRELVKHSGAVAVLPLTKDQRLVLVEQFRKPLERVTVEIPAGKLEPGEDPLACAQRELAEETGFTARKWSPLVSFFTSPGFADEKIHLYVAEQLEAGKAAPDEDEFVHAMQVTFEEAQQLIAQGRICDAKTVTAVYAWHNRLLTAGRD
ncbi:NUDIX domain-containing protein [Numidum massiliense]|uniref:NUDIX domain-containing protein n=1 Tax=Numidum massiliense TaxID=1522315 RepID=UPI0006D546F8|nr:NUDIX hydrolase [Numidum massiliense]